MDNLFDSFRKNLENRPEPEFVEKDWQDLKERLDQQDRKSPSAWIWWWVVLPLSLLLVGTNTALISKIRDTRRVITVLEGNKDTVYLINTVYRIDTIHTIQLIKGPISDTAYSKNSGLANTIPFFEDKSNPEQSTPSEVNMIEDLPVRPTAVLKLPVLYLTGLSCSPQSPPEPKLGEKVIQKLYAMRPKGLEAGLSGGWAYPLPGYINQQPGFSEGISLEVPFLPRWSLVTGASFQQSRFLSNVMDPAKGVPIISPPDNNLEFVLAKAYINHFQISFGGKYTWKKFGKWRPFNSIGIGRIFNLPYQLIYDFERYSLDISWKYETKVQPFTSGSNFCWLNSGMEWHISKKIILTAQVGINNEISEDVGLKPHFSGMQLGLRYCFW
jgi:hypothetical protein